MWVCVSVLVNEQSLQPITKSILNALDYLHTKHIIHRCVCPENIYISQSGNVYLSGFKYSVSLIDQGQLAKKLHDYPSNINDYVNYLSPEFLQQVNKMQLDFRFSLNNLFEKCEDFSKIK